MYYYCTWCFSQKNPDYRVIILKLVLLNCKELTSKLVGLALSLTQCDTEASGLGSVSHFQC
jgi:hypothetical protein